MSLAVSIFALFILLIQSVNGKQFLHTTCILLFPPPAATSTTVLVPLTHKYIA